MATLNEHQARRIKSTFAHVDGLLRDVERLAHAHSSVFSTEQPDLSEPESRMLLSLVKAGRARMLATLDHLHLPRPRATLSSRWSVMTSFRFVDIALSELTPQTLRGYGAIDTESSAEVEAIASELRELMARGREVLGPQHGEQLRERASQVRGPFGEVLRMAESLSTSLGLVEVRGLIAAAAERATTDTIDVGIFGRVSSGKSSLINALVGVPLLPVGATPVTAVPLRVVHGPDLVRVFFADGHDEVIGAERLPDYATESGNRDNVRRVRSILIRTPHLPLGLALLDTPGVGSLSQSGPAQTFAWLPRCDVGIVLVAAGTPLGRDEVALVGGLTHAGIAVEVPMSKSDLIPESERTSAIEYVRRDIAQATGSADIRVRAMSVVPGEDQALVRWRDDDLLPMVATRQELSDVARTRRARAPLGALNAALMGRGALEPSTVEEHRGRNAMAHEIELVTDELGSSADTALDQAAQAAVVAWREGSDARDAARRALLDGPNAALLRARAAADSVLEQTVAAALNDAARRIPPLFDPPFLDTLPIEASPGALDRLLSHSRARHHLAPLRPELAEAYGTYGNRLRAWALERLRENAERHQASQSRATTLVPPALREFAALVDALFPG